MTGHCWELEEDSGFGVARSVVTEVVPDWEESEEQLAGLAAAVAVSVDGGISLEVENEEESADV